MSPISLQQGILYGPVFSRRLGRSLGINLLPTNRKVCSFDCIYCQYGKTAIHNLKPPRELLPPIDEVLHAVERALRKPRSLHYLTFSGNGEPTLHPDFYEIALAVKEIILKVRPEIKLAVLSNGSRLTEKKIRLAYEIMDKTMIKLDAGDAETFQAINCPAQGLRFAELTDALLGVPNLIVQSCLIDGRITNSRGRAYESWVELLAVIKPKAIHIYSAERSTIDPTVKKVDPAKLQMIEEDLCGQWGLKVESFWHNEETH